MSKLKKINVILLSLITTLGFGACTTPSGEIPEGYDVVVTYYFNGGAMEKYSEREDITVYYKPGSYIAEPGVTTLELDEVKRTGYSSGGWYYAQTDENGNVVLDENENPIASDRKFDFVSETVTSDITLVIKWEGKIKVIFNHLYSTQSKEYSKAYKTGDAFKRPGLETSAKGGKVEGYYWSYDEATDTYTDEIVFDGLTFDDLSARLGETPEKDGDYSVLHVYVKLVPETEE
ncbi:MAG: hypothetical protein IKD47_01600 [Clostridia bacterium]|nr:hypothetical protein [Clostridia bacterium]